MAIFLIVGVDQEGDAQWDVAMTLKDARSIRKDHAELAFDTPKIFEIDPTTLASTERQ